jgi:hypothetical protein
MMIKNQEGIQIRLEVTLRDCLYFPCCILIFFLFRLGLKLISVLLFINPNAI